MLRHSVLELDGKPVQWMRQRLNAKAEAIRELTDELSLRLLERTEAPITAHKGLVCADIDTFVMDNSGTKQGRGRTHLSRHRRLHAHCGLPWQRRLECRTGTEAGRPALGP